MSLWPTFCATARRSCECMPATASGPRRRTNASAARTRRSAGRIAIGAIPSSAPSDRSRLMPDSTSGWPGHGSVSAEPFSTPTLATRSSSTSPTSRKTTLSDASAATEMLAAVSLVALSSAHGSCPPPAPPCKSHTPMSIPTQGRPRSVPTSSRFRAFPRMSLPRRLASGSHAV